MANLTVSDLTAGYLGVEVVSDINLTVNSGEVVVLMGRNGVGKSTTLLGISGFLPKTGGKVTVDGTEITGPSYSRAKNGLSIVLEGRSVFPSLTVRHNFEIADAPIEPILEWFPELGRMLDRPAGTMSGGEQQMLALGRALARRPKVLLVDELSFGLAPVVFNRLLGLLREQAKQTGMGILVVEQHLSLAKAIADRAYIMSPGRIQLEVTRDELDTRADEIERLYLGESEAPVGA